MFQRWRRQFRQFSSFDGHSVAVVKVNEIAQDLPCASVYRQRRYSRVGGLDLSHRRRNRLEKSLKNKEMRTKNATWYIRCSVVALDHEKNFG